MIVIKVNSDRHKEIDWKKFYLSIGLSYFLSNTVPGNLVSLLCSIFGFFSVIFLLLYFYLYFYGEVPVATRSSFSHKSQLRYIIWCIFL